MQKKEVIILHTDKSGKFAVTSREEYLKMGSVHTKKDRVIGRKEIIEIEKQINGHATFLCRVLGTGDANGQKPRVIESKVCRAEALADMYVMVKDHKDDGSSRPVVTGCSSNTRGLSNSVSDVLESVANAVPDPYECISSEDNLGKVRDNNIEAKKIMEEGKMKKLTKLRCRFNEESC